MVRLDDDHALVGQRVVDVREHAAEARGAVGELAERPH
jgi:hypothetical protein